MSEQFTSLRRRSYRFIQNYDQAWQNIVNVLTQNDYCMVNDEPPFVNNHPVSCQKVKTEHTSKKMYTPIDRVQLFESEQRVYDSTKLRPQSSKPKQLVRRQTDYIDDLQALQGPVDQNGIIKTKLMKRPMSSFTKSKLQAKEKLELQSPTKSLSQKLYIKPFIPPSNMSAYSYLVLETPHTIHVSWNSQTSLEVASLTKIMTCFVALRLVEETKSNLDQTFEVGSLQTNLSGTTADLQKGFYYSLRQLLYGLMLPSGNDASMAIAVWGGRLIYRRNRKLNVECLDTEASLDRISKKDAISLFIQEMNRVAQQIGMKRTHYANTHGLPNSNNKSTAYDISTLCKQAMNNPQFRRIVSTKEYRTCAENRQGRKQILTWQNTHRLLGIKTGFTSTAGGCLASYLTLGGRDFIIVVLKCKKVNSRFKQTQILKRWLIKKEGIKKQEQNEVECADDVQ